MSRVCLSAVAAGAAILLHGCGMEGPTTETTTHSEPTSTTTTVSLPTTAATSTTSSAAGSTTAANATTTAPTSTDSTSTATTTTTADATTTTKATTTITTTTAATTTTSEAPVTGLLCADSEKECVADLNKLYLGFDEANDASPLGVPIRGRPRFDAGGEWYYCTGQCFDNDGKQPAQPDCYTAAGLINHKIMTTADGKLPTLQNSKSGRDSFFARYSVLIVLQPQTALTRFTKCAWQFDGAAFNRQNGGCGSGALQNGCKDPESSYNDQCHDDKSRWADESCPYTMKAYCGNASVGYETNCFWKGPAFGSPVYPGAKPDFDFSGFAHNNEIRSMMKNRVSGKHQDGTTDGGLPLREYWNEITMDGRIIRHFEDTQGLRSVVAAVAFVQGNGDSLDAQSQHEAQKFQDYFKQLGSHVPLLVLDTDFDQGTGPFKALSSASILV